MFTYLTALHTVLMMAHGHACLVVGTNIDLFCLFEGSCCCLFLLRLYFEIWICSCEPCYHVYCLWLISSLCLGMNFVNIRRIFINIVAIFIWIWNVTSWYLIFISGYIFVCLVDIFVFNFFNVYNGEGLGLLLQFNIALTTSL